MNNHRHCRSAPSGEPRGVAAVEFAVMAPLFLMLILGILEFGSGLNAGVTMNAAIREGGRLASMDFTEVVSGDMTANQKVENDIRNFLTAAGIPGDQVTISITHADGLKEGQVFNLEDENNYLELFRITAEVPYEEISTFPLEYLGGEMIRASLVFRKGRVSLSG